MRVGDFVLETDNLSVYDLSTIIAELRNVRDAKKEAVAIGRNFQDMMNRIREQGYNFCNKNTGEVLKETDWAVYCEATRTIEEWD